MLFGLRRRAELTQDCSETMAYSLLHERRDDAVRVCPLFGPLLTPLSRPSATPFSPTELPTTGTSPPRPPATPLLLPSHLSRPPTSASSRTPCTPRSSAAATTTTTIPTTSIPLPRAQSTGLMTRNQSFLPGSWALPTTTTGMLSVQQKTPVSARSAFSPSLSSF